MHIHLKLSRLVLQIGISGAIRGSSSGNRLPMLSSIEVDVDDNG